LKFHAAHRVLIRRDDVKIDVVTGGATCYVDRFDLKWGRRYWYFISAYDQMALESPRTADIYRSGP
jgi:hypothetical protein